MLPFLNGNEVFIYKADNIDYPKDPPFHPEKSFPEYPFSHSDFDKDNEIYNALRIFFKLMKLDAENFGSKNWNPFRKLIFPGDTVVVKPNLIKESHLYRNDWEYIITHGSVIRAVIDYILIALKNQGSVIIADGPQTDSSFEKICKVNGLREIIDFYKKHTPVRVEMLDLRREEWKVESGVVIERQKLKGDPKGYTRIDLGEASEFYGYTGLGKLYGADFDVDETNHHHTLYVNEYLISKTVLDADVIINLPKLKTHKKAGITCSLKNLVGVNGDKNWLPHYTLGTPSKGGDQFPNTTLKNRIESALLAKYKWLIQRFSIFLPLRHLRKIGEAAFGDTEKVIRSGNWYGNDTLWRTILDLNKILFYGSPEGRINNQNRRRYLSIVDGIIGGDGNGPMAPEPFKTGLFIGGVNPVATDIICASVMGFDYRKIPHLVKALEIKEYPVINFSVDQIEICSNQKIVGSNINDMKREIMFHFKPHFGWEKHIEFDNPDKCDQS